MRLTLHYAPISCSLVPYLALTEAGADFEVRVVDFKRGAHVSEEYLRVNPKHQVPVLVIDGEPLTRKRCDPAVDRTALSGRTAAADRRSERI